MATKRAERIELANDVVLSQYGEKPGGEPFRDGLRPERGETEVSLIYGRVSAEQASLMVRKIMSALRDVRYTTVGALREAGFRVVHSPTAANSLHVSVHPPVEQGSDVDWDDAVASRFTACFERGELDLGPEEERGGGG